MILLKAHSTSQVLVSNINITSKKACIGTPFLFRGKGEMDFE